MLIRTLITNDPKLVISLNDAIAKTWFYKVKLSTSFSKHISKVRL